MADSNNPTEDPVATEACAEFQDKNLLCVDFQELLFENQRLREQLKEVKSDRNRLLCEVSNLRLELDMSELKRLPEESFNQKPIERSGSPQYGIAQSGPTATTSLSNDSNEGYVYLQQHCAPPAISTGSSISINYPMVAQSSHIIYQHQPQITCHQQQFKLQPNIAAGTMNNGQLIDGILPSSHHHHHFVHGHHHHHGGAVVIAGSNVGTGLGGCGNGSGGSSPAVIQHNLHKKNSIRNNNDVLKRSRLQTAYELSQDLLEKQIELLERKYGGVCARNAAITIQRAFRHYMMVKKFASITAMAKAEKRLSRRMVVASSSEDSPMTNVSLQSVYSNTMESQNDDSQTSVTSQSQQQPKITIMAGPPGATSFAHTTPRTPPTRSLSMRERRQLDSSSPIPRSQSGSTSVSATANFVSSNSSLGPGVTHPHVNMLHASESQYYSGCHVVSGPAPNMNFYPTGYHVIPHDISFASSNTSGNLDPSLNSSWTNTSGNSPHTPYYSAAQIYMRPKGTIVPIDRKKVPPEVPKRTSSITAQQHAHHLASQQQHQQMLMIRQTTPPASLIRTNGLCKTAENGSLTSVQSSGSDSSVTSTERIANSDLGSDRSNSPHTWKRGSNLNSSQQFSQGCESPYAPPVQNQAPTAATVSSAVSIASDDHAVSSHTSAAQYEHHEHQDHNFSSPNATPQSFKVSEIIRKRQYRVGLNLFNKKPEKGITYLIRRGFLENTSQGVARFLISRKGLSRQMIGEYLGNLQNQFNMTVLNCFSMELDLSGMQVDVALRKFQGYFRMPGEAQKIERLMEIFSHRFSQCNQDIVGRLRSSDTIFVLAFAIIMLNTDLHTPNLKPERRMRCEDFIKNLRGIDDCHDIDKDMLAGIYERVKANEFKPGSDHVTQVMKVQATIVGGKKPNLALPHRRLVCYCRLYEIPDLNKKERPGVHQREVFLFNDLLVITKIFSKKKSSVTYTFRNSFPLCGIIVTLLGDVSNYPFCIQLSQKVDGKILITFNARNEHDRCKFADDLKESISEMDEMEALRIEAELERQKSARNRTTGSAENRDSGVADVEVCPCPFQPSGQQISEQPAQGGTDSSQQLKRSAALSNSLLDMHEQFGSDKPQRRGSVGSLDSGMSISFQSTTTSSASRENAAIIAAAANAAAAKMRYTLPSSITTAVIGGVYAVPGVQGSNHHNLMHMLQQQQMQSSMQVHHHQQAHQQQQQQQQQQPKLQAQLQTQLILNALPVMAGRSGLGRERKISRSEDNSHSTEV